jgi:hypothetical protein
MTLSDLCLLLQTCADDLTSWVTVQRCAGSSPVTHGVRTKRAKRAVVGCARSINVAA